MDQNMKELMNFFISSRNDKKTVHWSTENERKESKEEKSQGAGCVRILALWYRKI